MVEIGDAGGLIVSALLISVSLTIQAAVLTWMQQTLAQAEPWIERHTNFWPQMLVMNLVVYTVALNHLLQMAVWALVYWKYAGLPSFGTAFYHSALQMTTMDNGAGTLPNDWLMVAAAQGLTGWIMFSWSTSALFAAVSALISMRRKHLAAHRH